MSFLGFGQPQPTSAQKIYSAKQELEMVTDMFNRLTQSCYKKCIPPNYQESELNKGESVCLDRCVSKFFDVNNKVTEKMQSLQGQAMGRRGGGGAGGGGGAFGS